MILTDKIFGCDLSPVEYFFQKYPHRSLKPGAMVTRFAPSPTGYMHIGGIYVALISQRFASQSEGVYFLRIEDTDKAREVEGTRGLISESLHKYGLDPDEGATFTGSEVGNYGPYRQSERMSIYKAFVKHLIDSGRAYPCFCSKDGLDAMRGEQEKLKVTPGYYDEWAKCRDLSDERVNELLDSGADFVIRLKSSRAGGEFTLTDLIKGRIRLPENNKDAVIMKSDGFPTYHLAHVVDDYLMGTTHVFRSDDWVSSVPLHRELFEAFGFPCPQYGHVSPITKIDENGGRRKLSKRKDPEANVFFYQEVGYPEDAVIEYLLNLANSDFEDWRKLNPEKHYTEFALSLERFSSTSGPLFDEDKLKNISRDVIANMGAEDVFSRALEWSLKYDAPFSAVLQKDRNLWLRIFSIERGGLKKRKDICAWSDVKSLFSYVDSNGCLSPDWSKFNGVLNSGEIEEVLTQFSLLYSAADTAEEWMEKIQAIASSIGLAPDAKTFKKNREQYRGHVGEVSRVIRYAITGRAQTPDLYSVMISLGENECKRRLAQRG